MTRLAATILLTAALIPAPVSAKSIAQARSEIVDATMVYLNTPYLWGGMHPGTGMDCSAFVKLAYGRAGLELPRVSRDQFRAARRLPPEGVLPGDIIFFAMKDPGTSRVDHVGIYVGKGFFVHASFTNGVHIDSVRNPYYYARLVSVRKHPGL